MAQHDYYCVRLLQLHVQGTLTKITWLLLLHVLLLVGLTNWIKVGEAWLLSQGEGTHLFVGLLTKIATAQY